MDFTSAQITRMRDTQVGHMQDTCVIQTCVQTANSYGELVETFTDGSAIECGLDMGSGSERRTVDNITTQYDATLRLGIATSITSKDRIKVTKRFEETLGTALVYTVAGPIRRGVSGIRIPLRKVDQ